MAVFRERRSYLTCFFTSWLSKLENGLRYIILYDRKLCSCVVFGRHNSIEMPADSVVFVTENMVRGYNL